MEVDVPHPIPGKVRAEEDNPSSLLDTLKEYFLSNQYCVLELEGRYITLFKHKGCYWFFDSEGRDDIGDIIKPPIHHFQTNCFVNWPVSLACVMRYTSLRSLTNKLAENTSLTEDHNVDFVLHSVIIKRKIWETFLPPQTVEDFNARLKYNETKKGKSIVELNPKPIKPEVIGEFRPRQLTIEVPDPIKLQELARKPIERPTPPSVTYFREIFHNKVGILRGNLHQNDLQFTKNGGKQSLANAVAALAMLKEYKSRHWISRIVDDILITGELLYLESRKNLEDNQPMEIKYLAEKLRINSNEYQPFIEPVTVVGKLNSSSFECFPLTNALEEFFTDHDTGKNCIFLSAPVRPKLPPNALSVLQPFYFLVVY